jgi:hypothetical protein
VINPSLHFPRVPQVSLFRVELERVIAGRIAKTAVNLRASNGPEARELARRSANSALDGPEFEVRRAIQLG